MMFDPDKPGTTFETLDVLTSSLQDVSSKVLLILNKVDDFKTVHVSGGVKRKNSYDNHGP